MFEQLGAGVVDRGERGIGGEGSGGEFGREVFACVEVFEDAGGCFEVGVGEGEGCGWGGG